MFEIETAVDHVHGLVHQKVHSHRLRIEHIDLAAHFARGEFRGGIGARQRGTHHDTDDLVPRGHERIERRDEMAERGLRCLALFTADERQKVSVFVGRTLFEKFGADLKVDGDYFDDAAAGNFRRRIADGRVGYDCDHIFLLCVP